MAAKGGACGPLAPCPSACSLCAGCSARAAIPLTSRVFLARGGSAPGGPGCGGLPGRGGGRGGRRGSPPRFVCGGRGVVSRLCFCRFAPPPLPGPLCCGLLSSPPVGWAAAWGRGPVARKGAARMPLTPGRSCCCAAPGPAPTAPGADPPMQRLASPVTGLSGPQQAKNAG